jgi:hypothetical protein
MHELLEFTHASQSLIYHHTCSSFSYAVMDRCLTTNPTIPVARLPVPPNRQHPHCDGDLEER